MVTSASMEDALLAGDVVLADRAAIGAPLPWTGFRLSGYSEPRRGEVWVFRPSGGSGTKLTKRVAGVPGDTIAMQGGVLRVNGTEPDEPYVKPGRGLDERSRDFGWQRAYLAPGADPETYDPTRRDWGPLVVPEGFYFMLGDNRDQSRDSRYWGPIDEERFEGRVAFVYFSFGPPPSAGLSPSPGRVRWHRIGKRVH